MTSQRKMLTLPIRIVVIFTLFSMLFQFMHWPYGMDLMLYSAIVLTGLYLIRFFAKTSKTSLDYGKLAIVLIWFIRVFFTSFRFIDIRVILDVLLVGLGLWWFIEEGINFYTDRKLRVNKTGKLIYYIFFAIAILICLVGMLFRIQHWPYGALMFTSGVLLIAFMLVVDYFIVKRS